VVEIVSRPVTVKTQSVGPRWYEAVFRVVMVTQLICIQMPFAYVSRLIAAAGQHVAKAFVVGSHPKLVYDHAGRGCVFTGQQRGPIGGTDGHVGNRIAEVDAL